MDGRARLAPVVFAATGRCDTRTRLPARWGSRAAILEPAPALAAEAARIAARHPERAVAPHAVVPVYVSGPMRSSLVDAPDADRSGPV